MELALNQSLSFVNSLVHRQRHRLVQLLLLTESFIEDVSITETVSVICKQSGSQAETQTGSTIVTHRIVY